MKKNFLFAMAMAAVFAGCSSDDDPVTNAGGEVVDGDKYVALAISMPDNIATTRADDLFNEEDDLHDGLPVEYKVVDATLLVFDGTGNDATCKEVVKLSTEPWTNKSDDPNQITQSSTKVIAKVNQATNTSGALVILNSGTIDLNSLNGKTFTQVLAETTNADLTSTTTGFMMANAPLTNKVGSPSYDGDVTTLRPITAVYSSYAAAAAATNVDQVYVERAVAKVTLSSVSGQTLESDNTLNWTLLSWAISKKSTSTYIVRNTSDDDMDIWGQYTSSNLGTGIFDYRFIGTTPIESGKDLYRTYFAKDVDYDAPVVLTDISDDSELKTAFGDSNPQYCYENTFSVPNMLKKYTTNVVLKVQIGDGATDYYTLNGSNSEVYNDAKLKALAYGKVVAAVTESVIKAGLKTGEVIGYEDFDITYEDNVTTGTTGYLSITSMALNAAGIAKYTSAAASDAVNDAIINCLTTLNADLQNSVKLTKYIDGICYYAARIKHFNESTPWSPEGKTTAYDGTDEENAINYLGRYGVLRNNWYDLKVSKITNIGDPELPKFTSDPDNPGNETDDDIESYVVMQINILSWAKRSQNVEL